jgi:hypothetical protein
VASSTADSTTVTSPLVPIFARPRCLVSVLRIGAGSSSHVQPTAPSAYSAMLVVGRSSLPTLTARHTSARGRYTSCQAIRHHMRASAMPSSPAPSAYALTAPADTPDTIRGRSPASSSAQMTPAPKYAAGAPLPARTSAVPPVIPAAPTMESGDSWCPSAALAPAGRRPSHGGQSPPPRRDGCLTPPSEF